MANYKVPRVVEVVDELPLNATGKVVKETLREHAAHAPGHGRERRRAGGRVVRPGRVPGRGGPGR